MARIEGRLVGLVCLALGLPFAACANDTGRPKDDSAFGSGGFIGVVPVTPPSFGSAGTGGFSSPTMPTNPGSSDPGVADCRQLSTDNARGQFSDACIGCLCKANAPTTLSCTADCWALTSCVSSHCDPTDTNCILAACGDAVGGAVNIASVGALARQVPFDKCSSECLPPVPISDGGPENDF